MTRKTNEQHISDVVYPQTDGCKIMENRKDEQKYRKRNDQRADRQTNKHNDRETKICINKRC